METFESLRLIPLYIGIVLFILLVFALLPFRKSRREKGKSYQHRAIAGGLFGMLPVSIPFAHVRLYKDFMVVSSWRMIEIDYNDLLDVDPFYFSKLDIKTKNPESHRTVRIYSFEAKFLASKIIELHNAHKRSRS